MTSAKTRRVPTMTPQERFIEDARKLMQPGVVQRDRIPVWFRRALKAAFPAGLKSARGDYRTLVHDVCRDLCDGHHWLDHWGTVKHHDGTTVFVSEPYGLTPKQLAGIDELAKKLNCRWYISANSWHYTGHTIRVAFAEKIEGALLRPEDKEFS